MVETVVIEKAHGSGPTYTPLTGTPKKERLQTKDQYDPTDTTYPIKIPASDFNYSYWTHILLHLSGTYTKINNICHYSDGAIGWAFGTGGELRRGNRDAGDKGCPMASYEQAAGTEGETGYPIEDVTYGHDYFNGQTTKTADVASDTEGSPAVIDSADHGPDADVRSKAVVLQVKVAPDATHGAQTAETATFSYDVI